MADQNNWGLKPESENRDNNEMIESLHHRFSEYQENSGCLRATLDQSHEC